MFLLDPFYRCLPWWWFSLALGLPHKTPHPEKDVQGISKSTTHTCLAGPKFEVQWKMPLNFDELASNYWVPSTFEGEHTWSSTDSFILLEWNSTRSRVPETVVHVFSFQIKEITGKKRVIDQFGGREHPAVWLFSIGMILWYAMIGLSHFCGIQFRPGTWSMKRGTFCLRHYREITRSPASKEYGTITTLLDGLTSLAITI